MSLKSSYSSEVEMKEEKSCDQQKDKLESDPTLRMEVFDDKDYDIEEIKFWNFISKNKGTGKSNIVRTIVYKVPETSYVVKQYPIHVESDKSKTKAKIETNSSADSMCKKTNELVTNNLDTASPINQSVKKTPGRPARVQNNTDSQIKPSPSTNTKHSMHNANISNKYNSEDIILIDEDDDIIDYNDEENNDDLKNEKVKKHENSIKNTTDVQKESDKKLDQDGESDEETDYYIDENDNEENDDADEEDENEEEEDENDEDYIYNQNKKRSLSNKNNYSNNNNNRAKKISSNKPKVVIEKVDEPVSTIKIQQSNRQTRSRNKSTQLNKTNSSLNNASKINKNELNEIQSSNEKLRMTRSKSKLIDNKY